MINVNRGITLLDIYQARKVIQPFIYETPLIESHALTKEVGAAVFFKLENLQRTGSFKVRGAINKIIRLIDKEKSCGVVTASTGNHGRAVAYAAKELGISATICLSVEVPDNKVQAIRALGAKIALYGESQDDAFVCAERMQKEQGLVMVPPFDDPHIIAGQGTIGLTLLEELPSLGTVVVPLSGGGLISGIALALKMANPRIRVIGVSMEHSPVMYHSLKAGKPIKMDEKETLADSLRGGIGLSNQYTFNMVREFVDEVILVSEEEIASAMRFAFKEHQLILEGAGAVGIAVIMAHKMSNLRGDVVIVLSGGNVDPDQFFSTIQA